MKHCFTQPGNVSALFSRAKKMTVLGGVGNRVLEYGGVIVLFPVQQHVNDVLKELDLVLQRSHFEVDHLSDTPLPPPESEL